MAPRPSATLGAAGLATPAQLAPGAGARATTTQLTPEQQLAYFLTPQQQQELFDRKQQAEAAQREADINNQEAQAQHDIAVAQLQHARAKSAQGAVDEMIARGLLQSGVARGALGDIELAAFQQKSALDTALTATQQRNLAVRSQAIDALRQTSTYAQGLAGENLATGVRSMPNDPAGAALGQAKPTSASAATPKPQPAQAVKSAASTFKPFQPSWMQPPAQRKAPRKASGNVATKIGRVGSNLPGY